MTRRAGENRAPIPDDYHRRLAFAIDLPLSLIGDTLTLPYVIAYDLGLFGKRFMNLGGNYRDATAGNPNLNAREVRNDGTPPTDRR